MTGVRLGRSNSSRPLGRHPKSHHRAALTRFQLLLTSVALLIGACTSSESPSVITLISRVGQTLEWAPAQQAPAEIVAEVEARLSQAGIWTLFPSDFDVAGSEHLFARFLILRTTPTFYLKAHLTIHNPDGSIFVGLSSNDLELQSPCRERPTVRVIEVRGVPACYAIGYGGFVTIEWEEEGRHLAVGSQLDLATTIEWLESWRRIPPSEE